MHIVRAPFLIQNSNLVYLGAIGAISTTLILLFGAFAQASIQGFPLRLINARPGSIPRSVNVQISVAAFGSSLYVSSMTIHLTSMACLKKFQATRPIHSQIIRTIETVRGALVSNQ